MIGVKVYQCLRRIIYEASSPLRRLAITVSGAPTSEVL